MMLEADLRMNIKIYKNENVKEREELRNEEEG